MTEADKRLLRRVAFKREEQLRYRRGMLPMLCEETERVLMSAHMTADEAFIKAIKMTLEED